jgi:hypothetical protein
VTDSDALVLGLYQRRAQRLLQLDDWNDDQIAFLKKVSTRRLTLGDAMVAQLLRMERMARPKTGVDER